MNTEGVFNEEQFKNLEKNTNDAIDKLANRSPEIVQYGDNNKVYHIAGNGEINNLCKNCIIAEMKQSNNETYSFNSINEYNLLLKVKDDEILALRDLIRILKEEVKKLKNGR